MPWWSNWHCLWRKYRWWLTQKCFLHHPPNWLLPHLRQRLGRRLRWDWRLGQPMWFQRLQRAQRVLQPLRALPLQQGPRPRAWRQSRFQEEAWQSPWRWW